MKAPDLKKVLRLGHRVSIEDGSLKIESASGQPVPCDWMKRYRDDLAHQISVLAGLPLLRYVDYDVGLVPGHSNDWLKLQFIDLGSGDCVYVLYNCIARYSRTAKKYKKGDRLPGKRFILKPGHKFACLWRSMRLGEPRKGCEYHSVISRLRDRYVVADLVQGSKSRQIRDKRFQLANISCEELLLGVEIGNKPNHDTDRGQYAAKFTPSDRQSNASDPRQEVVSSPVTTRLSADSGCVSDELRRKSIEEENTVERLAPELQSVDEWLRDYSQGWSID